MDKIKVVGVDEIDRLNYLRAYGIRYKDKLGNEHLWEMVSRGSRERLQSEIFEDKRISDGAIIFAVDKGKTKVVMLKEFRVGAGKYVYMLPAGLSELGEDISLTAKREFKEETGLDLEVVKVERERYVSIGIINERVSVVYGYFSGSPSKEGQAINEDAEIVILDKEMARHILEHEEVTLRSALLLNHYFGLNKFFGGDFDD